MTGSVVGWRRPAAVFAVALVVRLGLVLAGPWADPDRAAGGDTPRYLALADNLRARGSFGLPDEEPARAWKGLFELRRANGTLPAPDAHGLYPEVLRTPGYPLAVVALRGIGGGDVRAVLVAQCLLGAAAAAGLWYLGAAAGLTPTGATVAALLWAVHPATAVRDAQLLTESLFNSLTVLGLAAAAAGPRGWRGWVLAGLLLGCAGLVRPTGFLVLPAAAVLAARRSGPWWAGPAVVVALALLPAAGWAARNAAAGNGFRVSSVSDVTLFYYTYGYTLSEERGADWLENWPATSDELLRDLGPRVRPGEDVHSAMRRDALAGLRAHPGPAARVLLKSWVKLYLAHSAGEIYHLFGRPYTPTGLVNRLVLREEGGGSAAGAGQLVLVTGLSVLNVLVVLLAAAGAVRLARRRQWALLAVVVLSVGLFTAGALSNGMERFRSSFLFALCLAAGACAGTAPRPGPAAAPAPPPGGCP